MTVAQEIAELAAMLDRSIQFVDEDDNVLDGQPCAVEIQSSAMTSGRMGFRSSLQGAMFTNDWAVIVIGKPDLVIKPGYRFAIDNNQYRITTVQPVDRGVVKMAYAEVVDKGRTA